MALGTRPLEQTKQQTKNPRRARPQTRFIQAEVGSGARATTGDSRFAPGSCCLVVSYRISSSCVLSLVFVSVANGSFAQHPYPAHVSRRSCSAVFIVARWIRFLNPAHVSSLCVCTSSACLSLFDFSIQHMLFTLSVFRRVHYSCRFLF